MNFEHKTVLIIHPAWHSAGSHRVFCSQVEAYRALGATVLSLAVAPGFRLAESGAFWDFYLGNTKDLMAHERFVTGPSRRCLRSPAKWPRIVELIYANLAEQMIGNAELSPLPERLLARNAIDLIHCNHFFNMPLALRLKERSGSPIILETHDVWANQFALRGGRSIYLNRKATVRELLEPELTYAALADVIVHVNADDCAFFTEALPGKYHVLLYPNADLRPPKPPAEHFLVVANANHANYLNVTWFLDRVAPLVRDLNVKIVGRVDELFQKDAPTTHERYRSAFVGFVEDLNPWYDSAIAVLLPEVAGTGLSIKTIEAMSTGAPLIATRFAFRGINADFSNVDNVWLADEPGDFARSMREAMKRRELERSTLRANGEARGAANALRANAWTRAVYEELFSFERYRCEIARIAALARKEEPTAFS